MPKFPRSEPEVVVLAETMIAGYTAHAADFPSIDASAVASLSSTLNNYQTDRNSQEDARAQAKFSTQTKSAALDALTELMTSDLKLSEVDVVDDPIKLAQIGWGPRQQPQPVVAPGGVPNSRPLPRRAAVHVGGVSFCTQMVPSLSPAESSTPTTNGAASQESSIPSPSVSSEPLSGLVRKRPQSEAVASWLSVTTTSK